MKKDLFEYNEAGNIIKERVYDAHGNYKGVCLYDYDEDGRLSEKRVLSKDEIYEMIKKYDGEDVIEEVFYDNNGEIREKYRYAYDNNSCLILEESYNAEEKRVFTTKYRNEHIIEKINYNRDENIDGRNTFEYDEMSNLTAERIYENENILKSEVFLRYDADGALVETKYRDYDEKFEIIHLYKHKGDAISDIEITERILDLKGNLVLEKKPGYDKIALIFKEYIKRNKMLLELSGLSDKYSEIIQQAAETEFEK